MDQNKICEFLVKLRKENNLSQDELANKLNISRQAISKWEQGICLPDKNNLERLSKIYKVSVAELLSGGRLSRKDDDIEILLNLHEAGQKEKKKNKKLRILIIIFAVLIVIFLFLIYYFFINYNKISVYTINASKNNILLTEGLLVKTPDTIYFRLGEIASPKKIKDIRLYYIINESEENLIYACSNCSNLNIAFDDFYGYNEYVDFANFDKIIENMKLDLTYEDEKITIDLNLEKKFSNNKLYYEKISPSISPIGENTPYSINPLKYQLEDVFEKNKDGYFKNIKEGSNEISAVILDNNLIVKIKTKDYLEYWSLWFIGDILNYKLIKKGETIESIDINYKTGKIVNGSSNKIDEIIDKFNSIIDKLQKETK